MNRIALNQRAINKLLKLGVTIYERVPLMKDDKVTRVPGLELVALGTNITSQLDMQRQHGDTFSDTILKPGWFR